MSSAPLRGLKDVIIVGAGPSGLLLALLLAQKGIHVTVVEMVAQLDDKPRATHYAAPAMYELGRAGLLPDMKETGFHPDGVSWRKLDGTVLAGLDGTILKDDPDRMLCYPLHKLCPLLAQHLSRQKTAEVKYSHKVLGLGQNDDKAWIDVETPQGKQCMEADYIVGCDGANSQVRRSLFGDEFPGKTWDEQVVATNTYYDFHKYGYDDSNFFIHPEHWHMVARISEDGMWRVTYGEKPGLSFDQLKERLPMKFEAMLPGHPKPGEYRLANFSPYKVHQRLAPSMRVGRVLLAADAAHLCNPFGGLGLTGGIVDCGGLYDCLAGIYDSKTDDAILDRYSEVRRQKYQEIVDPISSENLRRLFDQDPERAMETDEFLKLCKRASTDHEFSLQLQRGVNALRHDFTREFVRLPLQPVI